MINNPERPGFDDSFDVHVTSLAAPDGSPARRAPQHVALRRFSGPARFAAAISAVIVAVQLIENHAEPAPARRQTASPFADTTAKTTAPHIQPRLIGPKFAAPGEQIVVLAFKNTGLCGQAELRFDGILLEHRLTGYASSQLPGQAEIFLTVQVPRSATTSAHTLDLYGAAASGSIGWTCGGLREHRDRLATTTVIVSPRRR